MSDIQIRSVELPKFDDNQYFTRQYTSLLRVLGYKITKQYSDTINVKGGGMDMLFATNYNIIHTMFDIGVITDTAERDSLSQKRV